MIRHQTSLRRRAFTLVEMLLVLVILAVLAAMVIPRVAGQGKKAKIRVAGADIASYKNALARYEQDCDGYPASLDALVNKPNNAKDWDGPYVEAVKPDPWGNQYQYKLNGNQYEITSMGPDGRLGGDDDISSVDTAAGKR